MAKPNKKLIGDVTKALVRMLLRENGLQLSLDLPNVPQLGAKLEAEGVHVEDADFLAGVLDGLISNNNVGLRPQDATYKKGLDVGRAVRKATSK